MSIIEQQVRVVTMPDSRRAAIVDSVIPDDAPDQVKEGLSRRALVNEGGNCPCGAAWPRPNRAQRRHLETVDYLHIEIQHEDDCPAETELLVALVREWVKTQ